MRLVNFGGNVVAGGRSTAFGRLEIWHEFKWLTLSPEGGFAERDAEVACREMGHWGGRR